MSDDPARARAGSARAHQVRSALARKFALLPDDIARGIRIRPWTWNQDRFVNYGFDQQIVQRMLLPVADMRFLLAHDFGLTRRDLVFANKHGNHGVECFRRTGSLLVRRPRNDVEEVESWSRLISQTRRTGRNAYPKHLHVARYTGSSAKYGPGIVPRDVERLAVFGGFGHFTGDLLFVYCRFANVVGSVSRGRQREDSHILKVQLSRHPRPTLARGRREGWEVLMHGYPISSRELAADFPGRAAEIGALALPLPG